VIDDAGQFREYSKALHARGLLYCAAMNQAMNDHLAQFVKGAHLLTAAAIVALAIAAVPASVVLSDPSSPTQTKIVGPVDVSSPELRAVRDEVAGLKKDIETLLSSSQTTAGQLKQLQSKVAAIDKKLGALEKKPSADSAKGNK
jgi:septal ring factor EnvC (AmiA/AmiB activator)